MDTLTPLICLFTDLICFEYNIQNTGCFCLAWRIAECICVCVCVCVHTPIKWHLLILCSFASCIRITLFILLFSLSLSLSLRLPFPLSHSPYASLPTLFYLFLPLCLCHLLLLFPISLTTLPHVCLIMSFTTHLCLAL